MTSLLEKTNCRARRTENLSRQVYRQIKALILCNEILPGQKLHHQELSGRLGVSRTPVREALTRLVQEGYLALLPNRGFTCKEIGLQEANELYQLREALETFAVEKAIENLTETAFTALSARIHLYGKDIHKRFSRDRLVYDQDVHLEIARLSGNEILTKTLAQVFERIISKRRTEGLYDPTRATIAHQEHVKLLQPMKNRNAPEAVKIVRAPIRAGRDNVLTDLKQRQVIPEWRQTGPASAI